MDVGTLLPKVIDWLVAVTVSGAGVTVKFCETGAALAFGSDWPVAPLDPILGIYAAVTRTTLAGIRPASAPRSRLLAGTSLSETAPALRTGYSAMSSVRTLLSSFSRTLSTFGNARSSSSRAAITASATT